MDKKLLRVGGIYDKVEFCDIYGGGELIHIKHYGSSSVLGHLFNQGLVSGELLKSHSGYIDLVNAELPVAHRLPSDPMGTRMPRDVSGYTIVFGIISQSEGTELHLPFFAKVVLKSVYTRLSELGYGNVMLAKISCDPMVRVKRTLKAKRLRATRKKK
jgi:uncharacterized protein (TIGR04141 family)